MRDLRAEVLRHGFAVGLVLPDRSRRGRFCRGIENAGAIISRVFVAQFVEHVRHTENGAGRRAGPEQVRHRVECAVKKLEISTSSKRGRFDSWRSWVPKLTQEKPAADSGPKVQTGGPAIDQQSQTAARDSWWMFNIIAEMVTAADKLTTSRRLFPSLVPRA